jgi:hypothetical protein
LTAALKRFGSSYSDGNGLSRTISVEAAQNLGDVSKFNIQFDWKHWTTAPCTFSFRRVATYSFDIVANVQLVRITHLPDGKDLETKGPSIQQIAVTVTLPLNKFFQSEPSIYCRCEPRTIPVLWGGALNEKLGHGSKIVIDDDGKDHVCTTDEEKEYKIVCVAKDMNECEWSAENPTDHAVDICLYPGAQLICTDPNYQDLCSIGFTRLHLPGMVQRGPATPVRVTAKGTVACSKMTKQMPNPSVNFKIGPGSSPEVERIAMFNADETFQGPEGQIRIWILTDKASLAEIQEHMLFPKPTAAMYLRSLNTVAKVADVNVTSTTYQKCLDAKLLTGGAVGANVIGWYVALFPTDTPAGLGSLMAGDFADWWSERGARYGDQSAADLANALCSSVNQKLREFGAKFLLEFVPPSHRLAVAAKGGLNGVGLWLTGPDPADAMKALDVLESYSSPSAKFFATNVNAGLPADVKTRAEKIISKP